MILKGSQRGGGAQLARHLLNALDNDHITVQELRSFMADNLRGAFEEAHAISKGTRCTQFLFSLSLNPPKDAAITVDDLMAAADRAEKALGLEGQPRAVVVHEKEGRRHAHAVWSRIDAETLKAINLPHFKNRLKSLSKELYLDHGWELPQGHKENGWKNPLNFSLAEWQQAKRLDMDPREIKQVMREAWSRSDNQSSFKAALEENGLYLAKGDRRGFVALDLHGEIYSVSRWSGIKTKELNERLGKPDALPDVSETREHLRKSLSKNLRNYMREMQDQHKEARAPLMEERRDMVRDQRIERVKLQHALDKRWKEESKARSDRFATGFKGVWELLTGKARDIRRKNEHETYQAYLRDRDRKEGLFEDQAKDRARLQTRMDALKANQRQERHRLIKRVAEVINHMNASRNAPEPAKRRSRSRDFDHGPEL